MLHLVLTEKIGNHLQLDDYLPNKVAAVTGELWMSFINQPDKPAVKLADVVGGQKLQLPITTDDPVRFYLVSHDPSGRKTEINLNNAPSKVAAINKETGTPAFSQNGAAQNALVNFLATGYSIAKFRKIQYAFDNGFSSGLVESIQGNLSAALPLEFSISRSTGLSSAQTVYVRIAHSTNSESFGAWSDTKTATFTDNVGSGGSGGSNPPMSLNGLRHSSNVSLYWTNNGGSSDNVILRNGAVIGTVSPSTDSFYDSISESGHYSYTVANDDGSTNSYDFYYNAGFGYEI